MALDLNRFMGTFFDESQEHLETIEEKAMALEGADADPEVLNAIFRAAHSVKGGSGTFGFNQLTETMHELETLFDDLRRGRGRADGATVRLLLDACDVFRAHLARLKGGDRRFDEALDAIRKRVAGTRAASGAVAAPAAPAAPAAAQEESFFTEPAFKAGGEAYGLFGDDEPRIAPAAPAAGDKFGFFEPMPDPVAQPAAAEPASRAASTRTGNDQSSIRVSTEKIDRIVNLVGELVIAQAMLQQAAGVTAESADERLVHSLATVDRNTRELQQAVMSIRMMPMEFVFSRFPRLVYDVASRLDKKVQLRTQGHETELDKELIELLVDPLNHVVRNAIDHGIESPAERRAAGKDEQGTVYMRATHRGGSVLIEVSDDGRGLDRERILAKARELGMAADDAWTDTQVWDLIFGAGFSTASRVTDVSGRGVGMDVVRRNIASLGGTVHIDSVKGEGTSISIQLPLTLAVMEGMVVAVGEEQYIVPLEFVSEAFKPEAGDIRTLVNQPSMVAVRGEHLPIVRLDEVVELPGAGAARGDSLVLVVEVDNRRAALLVDALVGQQQLVVKSLETNLHAVQGASAATILGDGRVALILDVPSIIRAGTGRSLRAAA